MNGKAATEHPLPRPTRQRWQPLRLGLVELFHYDVEEFWLHDGHLLLRGNNGTGKSKVLSLTLPFLLDANMSASRVEPDGDRSKRMEWNLLMGKRHERRIGYTWIEFGRLDESGRIQALTLGCGLRAVAGRSTVDSWFFITDQRIGADLWLTTPEHTALSRERLVAAIGTRGQVFETAQAYRRAVDERLFRLGPDRYAALVETLIQLRQPQLSKNPNEERLSDALTEALPPLDRVALEDVAEALSELDDIRRDLDEIEAMRKAVAAFGGRYRRYAEVATRRRARLLRQAQTEYDNASRDLNAAQRELDEARENVSRSQSDVLQFEEHLASDVARLEVLRADPVMREAVRIDDARELTEKCRINAQEAQTRLSAASDTAKREEAGFQRRKQHGDETRAALTSTLAVTSSLATRSGLIDTYSTALKDIALPDGVTGRPVAWVEELLRELRAGESRRREQIGVIRTRLNELGVAERAWADARRERNVRADVLDEATESARQATIRLRTTAADLLERWRRYCDELKVLRLEGAEDLLGTLEIWLESLDGLNPMTRAIDAARQTCEQEAAARRATLEQQRRTLEDQTAQLKLEQQRLETGEDRPPPAPHTRPAEIRAGRAGAPLWQLVDFAAHVPSAARAGLEAALEAAGILDAWILPDGAVIDARTQDVILTGRKARAQPLTQWLVPSISSTGVEKHVVEAVLSAIECSEEDAGDAEAWVSTEGRFRLGGLRGAWLKPAAQYIGYAAREAARRARLAEIEALLISLRDSLDECEHALAALQESVASARAEHSAAPSDEALLRASADTSSAEQRRRDAQTRLGEAEVRVAVLDDARLKAQHTLDSDAQALKLPSTTEALDELDSQLAEYRLRASELGGALRGHHRALTELAEQAARADAARAALEFTVTDHREKSLAWRAAAEKLEVLQSTVGKQVDELLQQIDAAETQRRQHDRAVKDARAKLVVLSGHRGTAEQKCQDFGAKLEERTETRRQSIEGLRAFAGDTGFVSMVLPDAELPDVASPWGVEAALTVARRAEQALLEVDAADTRWERIQRELGIELTELQSRMSAQGHSATVEPSEHGLIVRIIYQQRPERPDALEARLDAELKEQRLILSVQERSVLEDHLEKEIAANLQRMMSETEQRVSAINAELDKRPTSTGVRYRLVWEVLREDSENAVAGLAEARKRLLRQSPDAWSPEERNQVGEFLQARIDSERQKEEQGTLFESLARALDYRRWHRFSIERKQYGQWKPLSGPASSGERALGLTVPLFAAASSHYESAHPNAPRLVLLDEAFAGIDDEARASCMGLIHEFDLDFVMTSEREWGCYPELPGLSICQLVRREGMDTVFVSRWTWDGRTRRQEADAVRRFPEAQLADS